MSANDKKDNNDKKNKKDKKEKQIKETAVSVVTPSNILISSIMF